jgi:hypothetical protein
VIRTDLEKHPLGAYTESVALAKEPLAPLPAEYNCVIDPPINRAQLVTTHLFCRSFVALGCC